MKSTNEERDPTLDKLFVWLKESMIQSRPGFLNRVRQRLDEEAEPADELIDQLLQMDRSLSNPNMVKMVRDRLEEDSPNSKSDIVWFKWMAPLAAAATLLITFASFQMRAPAPEAMALAEQQVSPVVAESVANDFELTRIFALAANLHTSADMSQLQSVDDLAILFD